MVIIYVNAINFSYTKNIFIKRYVKYNHVQIFFNYLKYRLGFWLDCKSSWLDRVLYLQYFVLLSWFSDHCCDIQQPSTTSVFDFRSLPWVSFNLTSATFLVIPYSDIPWSYIDSVVIMIERVSKAVNLTNDIDCYIKSPMGSFCTCGLDKCPSAIEKRLEISIIKQIM